MDCNLKQISGACNSNTVYISRNMDIGSFQIPEPRFISRGAAVENKSGRGDLETACIPK